MKFILFIIQMLITEFNCESLFCDEPSDETLTELTIDSILICLPGSKIKEMTGLYSIKVPMSCHKKFEGLTSATFNITLSNGCKTTLSINKQPLEVVALNGDQIGIQERTLRIDDEEAPFYRKFITLNNDEDACSSSTGLTYRESIYYYFRVSGEKFYSHCLGNVRIFMNPGIH